MPLGKTVAARLNGPKFRARGTGAVAETLRVIAQLDDTLDNFHLVIAVDAAHKNAVLRVIQFPFLDLQRRPFLGRGINGRVILKAGPLAARLVKT